jgi:hypothetical protein
MGQYEVGKGGEKGAYVSSEEHLLCDVADSLFVPFVGAVFAHGVDVLEIGLEELEVAHVGEAGVFVGGDFE